MPELPEVQTIVDELSTAVVNARITTTRIMRESVVFNKARELQKKVLNKQITSINRRGKFIIFTLSEYEWLVAHLRMTGKFVLCPERAPIHKHDRVIFILDRKLKLIFNDSRCFGRIEIVNDLSKHPGLCKLGYEPWDSRLTVENFIKLTKRRNISIKQLLLDQRIIAGIGNIYAAEILFDAGIHPALSAGLLTKTQADRLLSSVRSVLKQALKYNGTTISDYRRVDNKQGGFQQFLKVYGKKGTPCSRCGAEINRIIQNQRSTFLCPECQKKA